MSALEQAQADVRTAMKAGERERAAALRMIVDSLQQDAKLGKGDEVAVLQRERKKRLEAEQAFRDAGFADAQIREAVRSHWAFVVGTLRLIVAMGKQAGYRDRGSEDAVFEFNLRTWILGVGAMAEQQRIGGGIAR